MKPISAVSNKVLRETARATSGTAGAIGAATARERSVAQSGHGQRTDAPTPLRQSATDLPGRGVRFLAAVACVAACILPLTGCRGPSRAVPTLQPLPPIPLDASIELLNINTRQIDATLRASGPVDGSAVDENGKRHRFSANGILFFLQPLYLRFDVKKLGDRLFRFGSNATEFWLYSKEDDKFHCDRHDDPDLPDKLAIRPDQIADALALAPIDTAGHNIVQRVTDRYQQLLFLGTDNAGRSMVEREYWIDRLPPRVVRRVVFRDADGVVEMESRLDDYRVLKDGALVLPFHLEATWPRAEMSLAFDVKSWRLVPQVHADGPQFATPRECSP